MWMPKGGDEEKKEGNGLVAVAVDKDKSSQYALKWAIDNLLNKGQTVTLIHVKQKVPSGPPSHDTIQSPLRPQHEAVMKEVFLPFRCFCSRKEIKCQDIVLEDLDIAKAVTEYVSHCGIDNLVVGAASRSAFLRTFKPADVPTNVTRTAPDFCTVYVISKGKVSSVKTASRAPPSVSRARMHNQDRNMQSQDRNMQNVQSQDRNMQNQDRNYMYNKDRNLMHNQDTLKPASAEANFTRHSNPKAAITPFEPRFEPRFHDDSEPIKSPFSRGGGRGLNDRSYGELSVPDTDISFVSSGRPSTERMFPSLYDNFDPGRTPPRLSNSSDKESRRSFESSRMGPRSVELQYMSDFSMVSQDSSRMSSCSSNMEDVEAEMKRLRLELRQTMDMYSSACKEALSAKQKAVELHRWKMDEEQRMQEARLAEEAALAIVQKEKAKCKAAIEAAEAAQRLAELEAQKRMKVEMMAFKDAEEKKVALSSLAQSDVRYRRYTIEEIEVATECFAESRKIGEGGYGPVYKCYLDHTPVAVKVLRPDAAQGRSQFQQEVEVLSCIRHPNMVLLLGACPEYGCLVYEYMANGSLDDCLFTQGNNPVLSWQLRFRIAAEIATGLLFLHQTKPEPLVHRDLKPGNILLDRNYVSKISDVGLARLVPPSVANTVTQYRMTSTAGTFCYIDPEYQQTGMLGIKSDVYSLGIMLLQIITAKPPMGLTHHVERAIEKGQFAEMLDPAVTDWPVEEALGFAKLALQCAELRRKDRPDLGNVVLPELNRLRDLADDNMHHIMLGSTGGGYSSASSHSHFSSMPQEIMSDPLYLQSGYDSSKSRTSVASLR